MTPAPRDRHRPSRHGSCHDVKFLRENIRKSNHELTILETAGRVLDTAPEAIKGRRVLVVEDGPTLTHEVLTAHTASRKPLPSEVTKQ